MLAIYFLPETDCHQVIPLIETMKSKEGEESSCGMVYLVNHVGGKAMDEVHWNNEQVAKTIAELGLFRFRVLADYS